MIAVHVSVACYRQKLVIGLTHDALPKSVEAVEDMFQGMILIDTACPQRDVPSTKPLLTIPVSSCASAALGNGYHLTTQCIM
jgi:hypothetical protein